MPWSRTAVFTAVTVAALIVSLTVAAASGAAPTRVTWPVMIVVRAAPATVNDIDITYRPITSPEGTVWDHFISDEAGITTVVTEPPTCYPEGPRQVSCADGTGLLGTKGLGEDFSVFLADEGDTFYAGSVGQFEVHGGAGNDHLIGNDEPSVQPAMEDEPQVTYYTEDALYGEGGDDSISGRRGPDLLSGGAGKDLLIAGRLGTPDDFGTETDDSLQGGAGNDKLIANDGDHDLLIDCGRGRRDVALIDRIDPRPKHCEKVKKVRPR